MTVKTGTLSLKLDWIFKDFTLFNGSMDPCSFSVPGTTILFSVVAPGRVIDAYTIRYVKTCNIISVFWANTSRVECFSSWRGEDTYHHHLRTKSPCLMEFIRDEGPLLLFVF